MNVLVFGTSYVDSQERKWLVEQWIRILRAVNPGVNLSIVDTQGPIDWVGVAKDVGADVYKIPDNIGHLTKTGRDGWGRAFAFGVNFYAGIYNPDYIIHIECDLLFARPVMPIIERMQKHGIKALSTVAMPHRMMETGIMFLDTEYVRASKLIERYDWETSSRAVVPERRMEKLIGDDLFLLPLWGFRDDDKILTPATMTPNFPAGIDWLTHASTACYKQFLNINGLLG